MKRMTIFCLAIVLAGCSSMQQNDTWRSVAQGDEFSDTVEMVVTTGDFVSGGYVYTRGMRYYPVIGKKNGEIYFGVMAGGKFKIPVGSVDVRIDQNKTWTIDTAETPAYLLKKVNSFPMVDYGLTGVQADTVRKAQEQAMANYGRAVNPITAVGGSKAKEIIRQMLSGKRIIYRSTIINTPTSTTGEVALDGSLASSLREIGISDSDLM